MGSSLENILQSINDEYNKKYSNPYFGGTYEYSNNSMSGLTEQDEDALKHGWLGRDKISHEFARDTFKQAGLPDFAAEGLAHLYTPFLNSNISRWLTSLAMGTTDTVASGLLNVPGLVSGGLGKLSEGILGGNSMFTDASKKLFDWDAEYKKLSQNIMTGAVGSEPTFTDNVLHGAGTSLGFMTLGSGVKSLAETGLKLTPKLATFLGFLAQNLGEAATEAGNAASDAYASDKTRHSDALLAGLYSLGANAIPDFIQSGIEGSIATGLNKVLPTTGGFTRQLLTEAFKHLVQEEFNELAQEPRQQAVEEAIMNTFKSGNMSLANLGYNLGNEASHIFQSHTDKNGNLIPSYWNQVAGETAASTALTSLLTLPLGIRIKRNKNQQLTEAQLNELLIEQRNNLIAERDAINAEIQNFITQPYPNSLEEQIEAAKKLSELQNKLEDKNNQINNFWGDRGVTSTPVQDDLLDFFPDADELNSAQNASNQNISENQNISDPSSVPLDTLLHNIAQKNNNDNDDNNPPATPAAPAANTTSSSSKLSNSPSGNSTRVRTMRGTEADVRYRVVDANDLIASTKETGAPNPDYPQELQPRQRDREASFEQIERISNNLDPELVADNRLASDGAPVIGSDLVVESGNGRVMGISKAYRNGKAEHYRSWLINNAARFGLDPNLIASIKNPVLVRERISDVNRVQFTREANESSTAQMSATENALNDANQISGEMLALFDPEKSIAGNKDFASAFSRIIPASERGNFMQSNGNISSSGILRIRNALAAKAYNNTGILNRLDEFFDDDIKNVSNALINAAPKIAALENGAYKPELSIRDDIVQAVDTLANLKKEGRTVDEFLAQLPMFDNISDNAKRLILFFDKNKRSAKRISQGLIHYAEQAMNQGTKNQIGLPGLEDAFMDKSAILKEAMRFADSQNSENYNQSENEPYNQSDNSTQNNTVGHIHTSNNGQKQTLSVSVNEFSDNYQKQKQFFGRFLEVKDENGRVVARYSPYTRTLQMADKNASPELRQQVEQIISANLNQYLENGGFLDNNGKLKDDGNSEFRRQYRSRLDTTPEGKSIHENNLKAGEGKVEDNRSWFTKLRDSIKERKAFKRIHDDIRQKIYKVLSNFSGISENDTEFYTALYSGWIRATAHNAGVGVEDFYNILNLQFRIQLAEGENLNSRGNTWFKPAGKDENNNIVGKDNEQYEAATIITLYMKEEYATDKKGNRILDNDGKPISRGIYANFNRSTLIHESFHAYLRSMQDVMRLDNIPEQVRHDWIKLIKWLGIADIDLSKSTVEMSKDEQARMRNAHEKFAVSGEQFAMTGKAPKSWLKRAFRAFKQWLSDIYGAVKSIKYVGSDGLRHEISIPNEIKPVFNRIFRDGGFAPNSANLQALRERAGQTGESEIHNQAANDRNDFTQHETHELSYPAIRRSNDSFISKSDIERFEQLAYHGSGHIILDNKFNLRFIGSGEGNQMYGWGLYFAQILETARNFRDAGIDNSDATVSFSLSNGKRFSNINLFRDIYSLNSDNPINLGLPDNFSPVGLFEAIKDMMYKYAKAPRVWKFGEQKKQYIQELENLKKLYRSEGVSKRKIDSVDDVIRTLKSIRNLEFNNFKRGNIYEVDIPENDTLLDYYAPLSEQPDKVQKAIQRVLDKLHNKYHISQNVINSIAAAETGEDFYRSLSKALQGLVQSGKLSSKALGNITSPDMAASLILNQAGIPGLRYLDKFSRYIDDKDKATYNFVIWNTDLLNILGLHDSSDIEAKDYFEAHKNLPQEQNISGTKTAAGRKKSGKFNLSERTDNLLSNAGLESYNQSANQNLNLPFNPDELVAESGTSIDYAKSSELILTPDGSKALGYIDANSAKNAGILEGEIQANVGVIRHAEQRHGKQIRNAGYKNVQTFLIDVLHNWEDIREGNNDSLWLIAPKNDGHGAVAAVRLHQNSNGVYRVTTLMFARNRAIRNKRLLLAGRPTPAASSGSGSTLARAINSSSGLLAAKGGSSKAQSLPQSLNSPHNNVNISSNESYKQIIGINGARELDKAEGVTWRMDNLKIARQMERNAAPVDKIWAATNWMRGADGQWRFEIPDGKLDSKKLQEIATLSDEADALYNKQQIIPDGLGGYITTGLTQSEIDRLNELTDETMYVTISDVFDAPELFNAYPDIRNINFTCSNNGDDGTVAYYNPGFNLIELNTFYADKVSDNEIHKYLIHELQHAIQEIEGFASGGSIDTLKAGSNGKVDLKPYLRRTLQRYRTTLFNNLDPKIQNKINHLRLKESELSKQDFETLKDKLLNDNEKKAYNSWVRAYNLSRNLNKHGHEISPEAAYWLIGGEEESRNAEERADLSPEERRNKPLYVTEDHNRNAHILLDSNGNYYNETYNQNSVRGFSANGNEAIDTPQQQLDNIRKQYQGTDKWLKAPNGKKSNLTEKQWLAVRTPNFKRWFGDWENNPEQASKILDSNGEPLRVYHGTSAPVDSIRVFKSGSVGWLGPGIYFTPFIEYARQFSDKGDEGIISLFLNIRNPLTLKSTWRIGRPYLELLQLLYGNQAENIYKERFDAVSERDKDILKNLPDDATRKQYIHRRIVTGDEVKTLLAQGYDGINWDDGEFFVIEPNQAKSATKNNGMYSEKTEIYKQSANQPDSDNLDKALHISQQQLERVRKKYQGTEQWLKAPNGKKSNLTEKQWLQVRTPNFKRWFGDWELHPKNASKVLDENGEPKVVYHGTKHTGFSVFDTQNGAWFSDSRDTSDSYINSFSSTDYDNNTYITFLNIRNPLIVDYNGRGSLDEGNEAPAYWLDNSSGYDGVICTNIKDRGDYLGGYAEQDEYGNYSNFYNDTVYGVKSQNQIKSATLNNGNFDSNNPDIYYQSVNLEQNNAINSHIHSLRDKLRNASTKNSDIEYFTKQEQERAIAQADRLERQFGAFGNNTAEKYFQYWDKEPANFNSRALKALIERNRRAEPEFKSLMNELQTQLGGELILRKQMKTPERIISKANRAFGGDISKVGDVWAGTLVFDTEDDMIDAIIQFRKRDDIVHQVNRWSKPKGSTGYRDFEAHLALSDGTVVELQLQHRGMQDVKDNVGHSLYEFITNNKHNYSISDYTWQAGDISKVLYRSAMDGSYAALSKNDKDTLRRLGEELALSSDANEAKEAINALQRFVDDKLGSYVAADRTAPDMNRHSPNLDRITAKYLYETTDSVVLPLDALIQSKQVDAHSVNKARRNMKSALNGYISKRKPLTARDNGDGTYYLIDGNDTYAVLKELGAKNAPVTLIGNQNPDNSSKASSRVQDEHDSVRYEAVSSSTLTNSPSGDSRYTRPSGIKSSGISSSPARYSTANGAPSLSKYASILEHSNLDNIDFDYLSTPNDGFISDSETYFQIGTRRKNDMNIALTRSRPDMSPQQRIDAINEIEKLGESVRAGGNPKVEKLATHWLLKGHIILPEDNYKILDAIKICEQRHLDPMRFDDPNEILAKYTIKQKRADLCINPDSVPEFSHKVQYDDGITVYNVDDSEEGQLAVKRIIDSHWGEDANPWCLARRDEDGELDEAWDYWTHYSNVDKRIAFKNGKLTAFSATDDDYPDNTWWDRKDINHEGIPYTVKENGSTIEYIYDEDIGKSTKIRETLSDGTERKCYDNGEPRSQELPNGTKYFYLPNGQILREELPDGTKRIWYRDEQIKTAKLPDGTVLWDVKGKQLLTEILSDGTKREWDDNGNLMTETLPDGTVHMWYGNGNPMHEALPNGTKYNWHRNKQLEHVTLPDGLNLWGYENGQLESVTLPDGTHYRYYKNGQLMIEKLTDGSEYKYYENGQIRYKNGESFAKGKSDTYRKTTPQNTADFLNEYKHTHPDGFTGNPNEQYNQSDSSNNNFISDEQIERFNQLMYHGTRHSLIGNRFDLRFLSSGEGGQMFGYGIYLAENPVVSKSYRTSGMHNIDFDDTVFIFANGKEIGSNDWAIEIVSAFDNLPRGIKGLANPFSLAGMLHDIAHNKNSDKYSSINEAVDYFIDSVIQRTDEGKAKFPSEYDKSLIAKYKETLQNSITPFLPDSIKAKTPSKGNLYSVEGPDNFELLDWDAPISQQSEQVLNALKRNGLYLNDNETGEQLYRRLQNQSGGGKNGEKLAAMALNNAGIPGHRFWDAGNRNNKSGTHNFVIWNTDTLKVLGISDDSDFDAQDYFRAEDLYNAYLDSLDNNSDVRNYDNRDYMQDMQHIDDIARENLDALDNWPDYENYNQLIGVQGARRLDSLEGNNVRMDGLNLAKELERQNISPKRIWLATGWNKGKDGEWRYEIPYGRLKDDFYNIQKKLDTEDIFLHEVLNASMLFDAYPDLLKTRITVVYYDRNASSAAYFDYDKNFIVINGAFLLNANEAKFRSALIHEIQHAIQSFEGFSTGGSPDSTIDTIVNRIFNIINSKDNKTKKMMNDALRALHKKDKDTFVNIFDSLSDNDKKDMQKAMNLHLIYEKLFDDYERIAGEVEARNAQTRADMSQWQRIAQSPNKTEDTPRDLQRVVFSKNNNFITPDILDKFNQLVTHATGNIIFNNRFDLRFKGSSEGSAAFGHGAYFEQSPDVAEAYRRYGLKNRGLGTIRIHTADGVTYYSDDIFGFTPNWKRSDGKTVDDANIIIILNTYAHSLTTDNIPAHDEIIKTISRTLKRDLRNQPKISIPDTHWGDQMPNSYSQLDFLNSITGFDPLIKKKGNVYDFDIPDDEDLLDWDAKLENQSKKLMPVIREIVDEINNNPTQFVAYGLAQRFKNPKAMQAKLTPLLTAVREHLKSVLADNPDLDDHTSDYVADFIFDNLKTIPEYKQLVRILHSKKAKEAVFTLKETLEKTLNLEHTGEDLYKWLSGLMYFGDWTTYKENSHIADVGASDFLNSKGIPGHRFWDRGSRDNKQGTHNFVIWDLSKVKMTGIHPDSDVEAIDYFNKYKKYSEAHGESDEILTPDKLDDVYKDNHFIAPQQIERFEQLVYHGTDNRIRGNRFDLRFAGSSEGTAAYAYGAYFAENIDVAQSYRHFGDVHRGNIRVSIRTNDNVFDSWGKNKWNHYPNLYTANVLDDLYNLAEHDDNPDINELKKALLKSYRAELREHKHILAELKRNGASQDSIDLRKSYINRTNKKIDFLKSVQSISVLPPKNGNIYIFDIPEFNELLDWDKHMSRQSEIVRQARRDILKELKYWSMNNHYPELMNALKKAKTGGDFYKALVNVMEHTPDGYTPNIKAPDARASFVLNKFGIPGTFYLDSGSRDLNDKRKQTHNFVIWNTDTIKMMGITDDSNPDDIAYFNSLADTDNGNSTEFQITAPSNGGEALNQSHMGVSNTYTQTNNSPESYNQSAANDDVPHTEHSYRNIKVYDKNGKLVQTDLLDEDVFVVHKPNNIKSASLNNGDFNPDNPDIYHQIIGEKGAEAIDYINGNHNLMDNLDLAQYLSNEGKDAKYIRMKTGWELGHDGKWRYELPYGKLILDAIQKNKDSFSLHEIFDAPHLFNAYNNIFIQGRGKGIANMLIHFEDLDKNYHGFFNRKTFSISLQRYLKNDPETLRSVLVHELQHAIQHLEGFAKGGNPSTGDVLRNMANIWGLRNELEMTADENPQFAGKHELVNILKKEYDDSGFIPTPPDYELEKAFDIYAYGDRNGAYENAYNIVNHKIGYADNPSDFRTAKRLEGETEARNAEKRMNFSDEQRRNNTLAETEDIPAEEQIEIHEIYAQKAVDNNKVRSDDSFLSPEGKKQIEQVRKKYQGTKEWLKAPNGKKTNLSELQWLQVRTPNFKKWFGDWENDKEHASKILDKNGEPLVLYHGSPNSGFCVFNINGVGAWFTPDIDAAKEYTSSYSNADKKIYPVFLNVRNPYTHDAMGADWHALDNSITIRDEKKGHNIYVGDPDYPIGNRQDAWNYINDYLLRDELGNLLDNEDEEGNPLYTVKGSGLETTNDIVRAVWEGNLGNGNHDGVIILDVVDPSYAMDDYIVPEANQIKSAVRNNGDFSENPDVYKQIIGENGAYELDRKEGSYNRARNLLTAKLMHKNKANPNLIKLNTGWELAPDGKWRYEIQDAYINSNALFDAINAHGENLPFSMKLHELYHNHELFDAYPELADLPIIFQKSIPEQDNNTLGIYVHGNDKHIELKAISSIDKLRSVLIHEIQHAVQDIEGFADGGNGSEWLIQGKVAASIAKKQLRVHLRTSTPNVRKVARLYMKGNLDKANSLIDNLHPVEKGIWKRVKNIIDSLNRSQIRLHSPYNYLGGEIEARNAQNRADFTPEQRRNTTLAETQDNNDWLVLHNGQPQNFSFVNNSQNNEIYNQIIGEKGAREIDKANGNTNLIDNLDIAKKMSKAGNNPKSIRFATGWELGHDNKWKYEIPDGDFSINAIFKRNRKKIETLSGRTYNSDYWEAALADIFDAHELFTAYPELKNMKVNATNHNGIASYNNSLKKDFGIPPWIDINPLYVNNNGSLVRSPENTKDSYLTLPDLRIALLHEIQHAIQDIEGFAPGSNPEKFKKEFNDSKLQRLNLKDKLAQRIREIEDISGYNDFSKKQEEKLKHLDFFESMNAAENDEKIFWENNPFKLEHEHLLALWRKISHDSPEYKYLRTPGEREARNVETRLNFSDEQKKNTLLSESEDDRGRFRDEYGHFFDETENESYYQSENSLDNNPNVRHVYSFLSHEGETQIDAVRKKYKGTPQWLKAPNGKKSNLKEKQWLTVRTPNFINWFGDWINHPENASKVLDENGEPLVVIHQTGNGGFSVFDTNGLRKTRNTGAWFADLKEHKPVYGNEHEGKYIYHVFLNIRNPYVYNTEGKSWDSIGKIWIADELGVPVYTNQDGSPFMHEFEARKYIKNYLNNEKIPVYEKNGRKAYKERYYVEHDSTLDTTDKLVRAVRNGEIGYNNHDGVIIRNVADLRYMNIDDYVIFNPVHIKSATRNNGDFNPDNPDIYKQSASDNPFVNRSHYPFEDSNSEYLFRNSGSDINPKQEGRNLKHSLLDALHGFKGDYPELADNKNLIYAREVLRILKRSADAQANIAVQTLASSLSKLNPQQFEAFTRLLLINDIYTFKRNNPNAALPLGFTPDTLKRERERFSRIAQNDSAILNAVQAEHRLNSSIRNKLASLAKDLGLQKLADKISRNDFDSAMLDYYSLLRSGNGIKTNYIHAMGTVRATQLRDILKLNAIKELKAHYDIKDKLIKQFGSQWGLHIPNTHRTWNILAGNFIASAHTAQENVLALALEQSAKNLGLDDDVIHSLKERLSDKSGSHLLVLPKELADTLNALGSKIKRSPIAQFIKNLTTGWKKLALYFPTRAFKYNIRNLTGDLDPIIAANPHALTYIKQAMTELWTAYYGDRLNISPELREFQKRGGAVTTETTQELGDFKNMREFKHLVDSINDNPNSWKSLTSKAWDLIDKFTWSGIINATDFREQILRYACYLEYLHQMQNNPDGKPDNWGASVPEQVMSIPDIRDRAFKMSNSLLGAYDQVSQTGKTLRDLFIPFYSWIEVNAKRYYQLLKNGLTSDNRNDFIANFMKAQGIKSPLYAYRIGKTMLMVSLLSLLVKAFNHFVWPDDEDKLPPDIKERPHITLGHDPVTGDVLYFDRIGAIADNLEWLRGDVFFSDIKDILDGKLAFSDWVLKVCSAPLNKIIQGVNPFFKTPFELASRTALYPDFTNRRNIQDRFKYLAQSLGLSWPYKAITGEPHSTWDEFRNLFVYGTDADEAAYFYTLNLVRQYQENVLGKRSGGFSYSKRSLALQNLKRALRLDDKEAVTRYLNEYFSLGGQSKNLRTSLKNMHPLHGLSKANQVQFMNWISDEDKKYLDRANIYFQTLLQRFAER